MEFTDYYKLLNIEYPSTTKLINRAYKQQSLIYHPDKTNNNPQKNIHYQLIKQAHETLINPELSFDYNKLYIQHQKQSIRIKQQSAAKQSLDAREKLEATKLKNLELLKKRTALARETDELHLQSMQTQLDATSKLVYNTVSNQNTRVSQKQNITNSQLQDYEDLILFQMLNKKRKKETTE